MNFFKIAASVKLIARIGISCGSVCKSFFWLPTDLVDVFLQIWVVGYELNDSLERIEVYLNYIK